jgi:alkanesulfonate monooxygenase SsuD/methylene tetrahydromethanopterin reductase-like flavin-dependent oxidoreductase (luciferase family)
MKFSFSTTVVGMDNDRRKWDLEAYIEECKIAEAHGFSYAYKGERRGHGPQSGRHGVVNNAQMIAQYGLANTETLKFSSGIVLLPLYHPVTVIQDATMLNALYPGRYRLAVGAGYLQDDFDVYGIELSERVQRMRRGIAAINAYRSGEPFTFGPEDPWRGTVPQRDPAMGENPVPELWVGAWSDIGVKIAAHADGWETGPISSLTHLQHLTRIYREECEKLGKKPRISILREACIAPTDQEARDILGPYILDYHRIYYSRGNAYYKEKWEPWIADIGSADDMTLDHVLPNRALVGSPDTWIETLQQWQELLDPEEIILRLRYFYGPGIDVALDAMKMVHKEVMPAFRA